MAVSPSWNDRAASVAETVGDTTDFVGGVCARGRWKNMGWDREREGEEGGVLEGGGREERDKKIIRQGQSDKQGMRMQAEQQTHWNHAPEM